MCDSGSSPSGKCPFGKLPIRGTVLRRTIYQGTVRQGNVRWGKVRRGTVRIPKKNYMMLICCFTFVLVFMILVYKHLSIYFHRKTGSERLNCNNLHDNSDDNNDDDNNDNNSNSNNTALFSRVSIVDFEQVNVC